MKILKRNRGIVRGNPGILNNWVKSQPHVSYVKPEAGLEAIDRYLSGKSEKTAAGSKSR